MTVRIDHKTVGDVAVSARWFTNGAVDLAASGLGLEGPVYRISDDVSYTGGTGARSACAYFIGAMHGWARLSGALIPEEMVPFLRDVQETYRAGLTDRFKDEEAAGAEAARVAWELGRNDAWQD
ncbi:hypothetical protein [Streptomyces sp. 5-10]|uniref:hypothetical protein n=1 Tax=Streptomyces sp. 5-10 TaxID=878925 RepID=UPI00168BD279|nr:hypothetical protein [Streptomyces sp. 5-10]MBD3004579.1 hypothetical protein [Streptomyces sp. 5-10]